MGLTSHLANRLIKLEEQTRQQRRVTPKFCDENFPAQSNFITDPARMIAALCTRRAGKSYADGLKLYKTAFEHRGVTCLYLGLTRESVKRIMWRDVMKHINKRYDLGARFNETQLSITLPNGSIIYLLGLDSHEKEREKVLGQKYKLVIVDEAASFSTDLEELVYGVLKPACADLAGTIALTGTPGNLTRGLYYEVTTGKRPGWSLHKWTAYDNPYMKKRWGEDIAELTAANPRITETPRYKQHYLGLWVVDDSKLVYRYVAGFAEFRLPLINNLEMGTAAMTHANAQQLGIRPLPGSRWHYVLGVDLGYNDATAMVVAAYHDNDRRLFFQEVWKKERLDITATARRIKWLNDKFDFDTMVIDGANKQAVEEMRRRHDLPLLAAEKTGKADFIDLMNDDFKQGNIVIEPHTCRTLTDEYGCLIWDERVTTRRVEHPNCENHAADAALYAWRYCYQYLGQVVKPPPTPGSDEAAAAEVEAMEKAALNRLEKSADEIREEEEQLVQWSG